MKPSRIAILIAVILLVVGGTTAFAASSGAVHSQPNTNCAFRDADGNVTRPDMIQGLNRLSSLMWIMMIKLKAGAYAKEG